jgi:hypothetical protein
VNTSDYLLFTTSNPKGPRIAELTRLFESVDRAVNEHDVTVKHYVLLQEVSSLPAALVSYQNAHRTFLLSPVRLSLSRARNLMIHRAREDNSFSTSRITAFPDDDAWYPPNFLAAISDYFALEPIPDIFICRYGSNPAHILRSDYDGLTDCLHISTDQEFIKSASSNTLFLRSELASSVGYFDERLGIGARINGGEDLDYALRAYCLAGAQATISSLPLVGHRDWSPSVRSQYYAGSLFAIARSSLRTLPLFIQLLRKVGVGIYFLLRREMSLAQLMASLNTGLRGTFDRRISIAKPIEIP